jgi:hypothetical protein
MNLNTFSHKGSAAMACLMLIAPLSARAQAQTPADSIRALELRLEALSESLSRRAEDKRLDLHGFADVGAAWSSRQDPQRARGFNAGSLDLYLTPQFGSRTKALAELVVEYDKGGDAHVELERLQLGYTVSDSLTLWLGRFHTPFGQWNTEFHHGANLQTSVSRPRFIEFEDHGGLLPTHSVGLWASGKTAAGGGKVTYDLYIANAPHIADRTLGLDGLGHSSSNKTLGANFGYEASGPLLGLTIGVHGFSHAVRTQDSAGLPVGTSRLRMAGGYASYERGDWELMAELYHFANRDAIGSSRLNSRLGFVQVGWTQHSWTPYLRWEKAALNPQDRYFRSLQSGQSYGRTTLGARCALDASSSFKLELSDTRDRAADLLDEAGALAPMAARQHRRLAVQYAVAF